ncbi:site-specific DNA-methyltransferase [Rodentibacter trehalosifermentans]|uniref:site-specific DNA-methyltransferase n=1 Tax=Rodentibacter trehalosifermentans TaxID=1908263 RepID=UPI000984B67E|nr:site-specific DNA-methyltransferase [Rodentibacter trehalosifermentans]OOF47865.1 type III restriction endonuclease subunit M [Rodentibacter trehalosifermentans]
MIISENLFESSTNSSLEILKQHFPNCFDKNGNFLPDKMAEQIQSQGINTSREYYTMNWLGKSYARYLRDCPPTTLLAEDVAHNSLPENQHSQNLLMKGDNLEVLKHLKHAYAGEVKMIYIDPPYNTGSDGFVYQDDRKFTPEQLAGLTEMSLEEAKRVLDFTAKKSNSHSAWLTFMYPRLYIARELLKDDGVIFISIDDNEQAQLKLLCDKVFGEENFVAKCIHKNNSNKNQSKFIGVSTEYLFIFAKNLFGLSASAKNWKIKKEGARDIAKKFKQLKEQGLSIEEIEIEIKEMYKRPKYAHLSRWNKVDENGVFQDADLSRQGGRKDYTIINPKTGKPCIIPERGWDKSYEDLLELQKENLIWYGDANTPPRVKSYISENDYSVVDNFWYFDNSVDTKFIKEIFGELIFENPKSLSMIKRVIELGSDPNTLILDFFAGSGTTAHAVMQLNAEDGGNRRFMMVQLPEKTDKKSEAYKAGYKTIFDITKARIEKSAVKIRQDFPDFQGDLGFKIFETAENFLTVSDEEFNPTQPSLPETVDRVLSDEEYRTLLTTWRLYDGNALTESVQAVDLGGYVANRCGDNLYLLTPYFGSEQIKALLNKLDSDPDFLPKRIILFGANIDSAKQMELHQAVKTYANKKNIELNIVVRY